MTEPLEHLIFIIAALLIYLPAYKMKFVFSGKNYTQTKSLAAALYNILAAYLYINFLKTSQMPFYGHMTQNNLGWLCFIMMFLHAAALPMQWKRRPWRSRKIFDPKIRKHKLTFDRYRLAQPRKSILFFWKRS